MGVAALCFVSKAHGQAAKELFEAFGKTEGFFDENSVATKAATSTLSSSAPSSEMAGGPLEKTAADGNSKAVICRLVAEDAANEERKRHVVVNFYLCGHVVRKHSIIAPIVTAWSGRHQQVPPVFFPPLPFMMPSLPEKSTNERRDQDRHEQRDRARHRHHSRERSRDRGRRESRRDRPDEHSRRSNDSVSAGSKRDVDKHESSRHSSSRRDRSRERRDRSPRRSRH